MLTQLADPRPLPNPICRIGLLYPHPDAHLTYPGFVAIFSVNAPLITLQNAELIQVSHTPSELHLHLHSNTLTYAPTLTHSITYLGSPPAIQKFLSTATSLDAFVCSFSTPQGELRKLVHYPSGKVLSSHLEIRDLH